jgi:hypothetical protein
VKNFYAGTIVGVVLATLALLLGALVARPAAGAAWQRCRPTHGCDPGIVCLFDGDGSSVCVPLEGTRMRLESLPPGMTREPAPTGLSL